MDFVGWKIILQSTHELPNAFSAPSYCRRQRTIELAMKKVLSILRIETHDIGLQHINGEIRGELRNVLGIELLLAVPVIASHGLFTRSLPLRTASAVALEFLGLAFLDTVGYPASCAA